MVNTRLRNVALVGVLGGLGLVACKEKLSTTAPVSAGVATTVTEAVTPLADESVPVAKASPDGLAKALGYAKYLPKETEGYVGVFDGKGFVDSIRGSKIGKYAESRAAEAGIDLDEIKEDPDAGMILPLFAEEFFVAMGKGMDEQANNLMLLSESSNFHQMKFLVKMVEAEMTGKELDDVEEMAMPLIGGLLQDPKAGLAILEKAQVPPVTIGFKISDQETREGMSGLIAGGFQELLEEAGPDGEDVMEAVSVERGGATFSGVRIVGEKVSKLLDEEARAEMSEMMDPASIERLLKLVSEKNIVMLSGEHEGYLVLFIGAGVEELQVAATPADSLVARTDLSFLDAYADKKLLYVNAVSKKLLDGLTKNSTAMGSMAAGIKAGLEETEGFGDTRDMGVLLDLLIKQEKGLMGLNEYSNMGVVVYREEGLKIETFGGTNAPAAMLDVPHSYGGLAKRDGVLLFSDWVSNEEYSSMSLEYLDTIGEVAYLGAKRMSALEIDDPDFDEFKEVFGMFDEMFKADLMKLWKGIRGDLGDGLGGEGALIIDLKGGLPTVPGIPQVVADNGKAPRIGMVKPVTDREKISSSWQNINAAAEGLLKTFSEMNGENIPMQKPMTSEKDDLKTWFFASIPFQTDDFVLSVSVDEKNFFASTSKSFVQELSAELGEAKPDPARKGAYLTVNFKVLRDYANGWIDMVEQNAEAITGSPDGAEEVKAMLPEVREVVGAMDELQSFEAHTRNENGQVRSSMHFKVK